MLGDVRLILLFIFGAWLVRTQVPASRRTDS